MTQPRVLLVPLVMQPLRHWLLQYVIGSWVILSFLRASLLNRESRYWFADQKTMASRIALVWDLFASK